MRATFLKLAAISAGAVIGSGILIVCLHWYSTRPKPWNPHIIVARFKQLSIYDNPGPSGHVYYENMLFDVTNNSSEDYTLPVDAWSQRMMEQKSGSLTGGTGWELSMTEGNLPSVVPDHFFDPKPILIPAHTTVEILVNTQSEFVNDAVAGKTKQEVVQKEFGDIDALVVFDNTTKTRIDFPTRTAWTLETQK